MVSTENTSKRSKSFENISVWSWFERRNENKGVMWLGNGNNVFLRVLSCVKPRPAHLERMSGLPLPVSTTTVTTTITVFTCLHFHRRHYHLYLRYHGPLSKLPSPLLAPSSSLSHISSSGLPSPHRHLTLLNAGLSPLICTSPSFLYVHLPLSAPPSP